MKLKTRVKRKQPIDVHIREDDVLMVFLRSVIFPIYKEYLVQEESSIMDALDHFFCTDTRDIFWAEALNEFAIKGLIWRKEKHKERAKYEHFIPKSSVFLVRYDTKVPNEVELEYVNKNGYTSISTLTKEEWSNIVNKVKIIIPLKRVVDGSRHFKRLVKYYTTKLESELGTTPEVVTKRRLCFRRGDQLQKPT